ncbi:MAG: hypothetical protein ACKN9T_08045 [Candidatus Methylumidiphilus sp.]
MQDYRALIRRARPTGIFCFNMVIPCLSQYQPQVAARPAIAGPEDCCVIKAGLEEKKARACQHGNLFHLDLPGRTGREYRRVRQIVGGSRLIVVIRKQPLEIYGLEWHGVFLWLAVGGSGFFMKKLPFLCATVRAAKEYQKFP